MRVLVLGAGDVGTFIARELSAGGHDVVLVDRDAAALTGAEEIADVLTLVGSVTQRSVLRTAEAERANLAVVVTGSDETNLVAGGLAAELGARRVVARVDDPGFYEREGGVERGALGVQSIVCASRLVCDELLRSVSRIEASHVGHFAGNAVQVALQPVRDGCPLLGQPGARLRLPRGVHAVGVLRDRILRRPTEIDIVEGDDAILLSGATGDVLRATLELRGHRSTRRAVVVGGGDVGLQLGRRLARVGESVSLIESDRKRCEFLANELPEVRVVYGDGTSLATLRDEGADTADFSLSVTRADEVNLMSALVLRELGVPDVFTLVHRPGYAGVYGHLGIRATAGAHDAILRVVQRMLPGTGVLGSEPISDTSYELFELLLPGTLADGATLGDLPLPAEALLVAHARAGTAMPPDPTSRLERRDLLVVAARSRARRDLERAVRDLRGRSA
ncbi:MAG: Trk system potassium transporter TrkA [Polyangiaceae bacterium]|nr:Trk system potassium transporter TrkA [Polyangiaceae bacterium]